MSEVHNLDDVQEYFEFIVSGCTYRFRHMTSEEIDQLNKLGEDREKVNDFMYSFITKADETSPDFKEVAKKMTSPKWAKFTVMLKEELSGFGI